MRALTASLFGIILLLSPAMSPAAEIAISAFAFISVAPVSDSAISVSANVLGLSSADLRAELTVDRKGSAGTVSLKQARDFHVAPGESADVGHVDLSFAPGDALTATVTVRHGDEIVATARTTTGTGEK